MSCPQNWCECPGDRILQNFTYSRIGAIVGCDVVPLDFPVCPIGKCGGNCACREVLLKELHEALFPRQKPDVWYNITLEELSGDDKKPDPIEYRTEL